MTSCEVVADGELEQYLPLVLAGRRRYVEFQF
jgi:hypothetical protein